MLIAVIIMLIVFFLIGVGFGGAHMRKEIYNDIKRLEHSKITDGQFRDMVVNTYVTESETNNHAKPSR